MNLEIHGLTDILFLDIFLLWFGVTICILCFIWCFLVLYIDNGLLTIHDKNIIKKIIKLKNTDKSLYNFANKLDNDNIAFLLRYKLYKFDRVVLTPKFNQKVEPIFINDNEKRLFEKIDSIIYYYDFVKKIK